MELCGIICLWGRKTESTTSKSCHFHNFARHEKLIEWLFI